VPSQNSLLSDYYLKTPGALGHWVKRKHSAESLNLERSQENLRWPKADIQPLESASLNKASMDMGDFESIMPSVPTILPNSASKPSRV